MAESSITAIVVAHPIPFGVHGILECVAMRQFVVTVDAINDVGFVMAMRTREIITFIYFVLQYRSENGNTSKIDTAIKKRNTKKTTNIKEEITSFVR